MKKLNCILLAIISILSFFMLFNEAEINSLDNIKNIESTLDKSYRLTIPSSVTNNTEKNIYIKLKEVLDKYEGNIYYSRIKDENKNGKVIEKEIKYIYFNNLDYFNNLSLSKGRGLNLSENESDLFLSTDKTDNINQVGIIASINKNEVVEVHTLKNLIYDGLFDGYCYVQLPKNQDIHSFISDLEKSLNIDGIQLQENNQYGKYSLSYAWFVILGLYFFCMLIIIYDTLKSYKNIAIKKMMGFSNFNIYTSQLKILVLSQIFIQCIVTAILCFIKFEDYNKYVGLFLKDLGVIYILELLALIIFVTIPYIYVNKIRISSMIKNKQPTKEILIFNMGIKILIIMGLFLTSKFIMEDFNSFKNIYSKSYEKWEQMDNYVIIPTLTNVNSDFMNYMGSEEGLKKEKAIYTFFNKKGAILADFNEFSPSTRAMRLKETKYPYESDNVWVNPNYLKLNPIYDINGNVVEVSENEEKDIILVPEKYKKDENSIIELHKFWNNGDRFKWKKDEIKIIFIKNDQPIFSYNLDVNQKENNYVSNPFINVLSENNSSGIDYMRSVCYQGNPFKIKLDKNFSIDENVRPILEQYGFSSHVSKIVKVNEMVLAESSKIKEKMCLYFIIELIVLISLILVIVQSVFNFFNQYKQYLAIRYLNGYGIYNRYKEYFILILVSWLIISVGVYFFNIIDLYLQIRLTLLLIIFELMLSIIVLVIRNKKNIISTVKGS